MGLLEGDPELPLPKEAKQGTIAAIRAGRTRYSSASGLPELKAALSRRGVVGQVLVTNGAKQAIYEALQVLVGPGDTVLVPSPCWVTFPEAVKLAGAQPILVPMPGGFLDVGRLAAAVRRDTRAVIINTPNNPTGAVYGKAELLALAKFAAKKDLVVVSDEAYEALVYEGKHVSLASLGKEAARRTLTVGTFSKTYSMTGFRVGYLAGPPELVEAASRIHGHVTGNVCTFAQLGALAALGVSAAALAARRDALRRRRDLAYRLASRLFPCEKPRGGLFVFADARRWLNSARPDSAALARFLLARARVAVVPGSACGREGWLRFSFSGTEKAIREGFSRIEKGLMTEPKRGNGRPKGLSGPCRPGCVDRRGRRPRP